MLRINDVWLRQMRNVMKAQKVVVAAFAVPSCHLETLKKAPPFRVTLNGGRNARSRSFAKGTGAKPRSETRRRGLAPDEAIKLKHGKLRS